MRTTAAVSVTALDRHTTAMYCSVCGPVKVMALPFSDNAAIRADVTTHLHDEHPQEQK